MIRWSVLRFEKLNACATLVPSILQGREYWNRLEVLKCNLFRNEAADLNLSWRFGTDLTTNYSSGLVMAFSCWGEFESCSRVTILLRDDIAFVSFAALSLISVLDKCTQGNLVCKGVRF